MMRTDRDLVTASRCLVTALLVCAAGAVGKTSGAAATAEVTARPSAGCHADGLERGRRLLRTTNVGGVQRAYVLDVPERVQPHVPVPLLFDFHGFGHSAAGLWQASHFRELATRDGFITVYPDGLPVHLLGRDKPGWQISSTAGNRDLAFTAQLLDQLERDYCIDQARIFATGFSNGAFFTHLLGCTLADRFAAIAPVAGGLAPTPCTPARGVSVLIHHGRHDPTVDVQQARAARDAWMEKDQCRQHASNGCEWHRQCRDDAAVEYCEDDSAHQWPPEATERIWNFFREHPLAGSGTRVRE
ncbi:MAG: alpha/beta hydrolase family esterase [Candidatus Binatia bacterium]